MAANFTPAPANPPDQSSDSPVRLVAGLAALVIGVAALLGSAVQSDVLFDPAVAPVQAAIQTAGAPGAAGQDAAQTPQSPGRRITAVDWALADLRSPAPTTPNDAGADLATTLARGTRAESAQLATILLQPDGWDVRWGLIEMAAAQRRDWTRRCPCPVSPVDDPRGNAR